MYIVYLYKLFLLLFLMKKSVFFTSAFKFPSHLGELKTKYALKTNTVLKSHSDIHNIHIINDNIWYKHNEVDKFLHNNEFIQNKKLISLSPGGYKGFYVLGICKYIKENYNLDNYVFSGASAGAWNSLILSFRGDFNDIEQHLVDKQIQHARNLYEMEHMLKYKILTKYTSDDFDLQRLFIGVTTMQKYNYNTTIFSGFNNLEDALNCCIASSHIPLVTGGLTNVYRNFISFDGGFSKYPYLNITTPVLHITPSIWEKKDKNDKNAKMSISDYTTIFSKNKFVFADMVNQGYKDASENKETLDKIFLEK